MHLRLPSLDRELTSLLWGLFFGLFIWLGGIAVDLDGATAFIFGGLVAGAVFFYVRLFGGDEVRRPQA